MGAENFVNAAIIKNGWLADADVWLDMLKPRDEWFAGQ
jgi:hypothetical protein